MADFKKTSVALLAALALPAVAAKLPAGVVAVPMLRDANNSAYFAEFLIGTPPQKQRLVIDTGSPNYSFLDPRNPACNTASHACRTLGTFDNTTSSTSRYAGPGFADALNVRGHGDFLSDTFVLGNVTMKNMTFGYTSEYGFGAHLPDYVQTIAGFSLDCSNEGPGCKTQGPYLLPQLKNASIINRMASSFYFGPDDAAVPNAQMLLGGAYDKAKVDGKLFTVKMVDPKDGRLANFQTNSVNITTLEVVVDGNRTVKTYGVKNVGVPVLLDSGVARWYLPDDMFKPVLSALGLREAAPPRMPYQNVDCKYRQPENTRGHITVRFGPAGTITVPIRSLVSQRPDGTCVAYIISIGDSAPQILGDPFLRGAYVIYDQENWTVTLGQVKHTLKEDIVPFPKGGFKA